MATGPREPVSVLPCRISHPLSPFPLRSASLFLSPFYFSCFSLARFRPSLPLFTTVFFFALRFSPLALLAPLPSRRFARSRRYLNFFILHEGGKWNKMGKGGGSERRLHRRVGEVVPSSQKTTKGRLLSLARRSNYSEHGILYLSIFRRSAF